jgi:hypothetical protein
MDTYIDEDHCNYKDIEKYLQILKNTKNKDKALTPQEAKNELFIPKKNIVESDKECVKKIICDNNFSDLIDIYFNKEEYDCKKQQLTFDKISTPNNPTTTNNPTTNDSTTITNNPTNVARAASLPNQSFDDSIKNIEENIKFNKNYYDVVKNYSEQFTRTYTDTEKKTAKTMLNKYKTELEKLIKDKNINNINKAKIQKKIDIIILLKKNYKFGGKTKKNKRSKRSKRSNNSKRSKTKKSRRI